MTDKEKIALLQATVKYLVLVDHLNGADELYDIATKLKAEEDPESLGGFLAEHGVTGIDIIEKALSL